MVVHDQVANGVKHLPHLRDLCLNEVTVRSAKHILKVVRKSVKFINMVEQETSSLFKFFTCFCRTF